ncbi:MAG: hypothetical protein LC131_06835 [Anaerolineae bacterium]|nr:hypothetical protein [Anaerolineae bacterium]
MAKVMWKFKTKNFTVIWKIQPDVLDTRYMENDLANECSKKVRSGEWKCFMSEIQVIENSSKVALGEAFLGGSIYANPADFRDHFGMNKKGHGSYFSDMVREAIREARIAFPEHKARIKREIQTKQKLLSVMLRSRQSAVA